MTGRKTWLPLLAAAALAGPALAQQGQVEVRPLEPLIVPGATQNSQAPAQGAQGQSDRGVNPLIVPGVTGRGQGQGTVQPGPETVQAPPSGGFESNPEESGSFIDRAFGIGRGEGASPEGGAQQGTAEPLLAQPQQEQEQEQQDSGWMTGPDGQPIEPGQTGEPGQAAEAEGGGDLLGRQVDDLPLFKEAPFSTRRLFGPGQPEPIPETKTVEAAGAEIRQLDKMTGTTQTVALKTGETRSLDRLKVELDSCRQPPDGGTHGTIAYLRVWDPERDEKTPVFSGWMFAESPALSALDHPRYDLWVLGCTPTQAAEAGEDEQEQQPGSG